MIKDRNRRRSLAAALILFGIIVMLLAPETRAGMLLIAVGVALETAGIVLERRG